MYLLMILLMPANYHQAPRAPQAPVATMVAVKRACPCGVNCDCGVNCACPPSKVTQQGTAVKKIVEPSTYNYDVGGGRIVQASSWEEAYKKAGISASKSAAPQNFAPQNMMVPTVPTVPSYAPSFAPNFAPSYAPSYAPQNCAGGT